MTSPPSSPASPASQPGQSAAPTPLDNRTEVLSNARTGAAFQVDLPLNDYYEKPKDRDEAIARLAAEPAAYQATVEAYRRGQWPDAGEDFFKAPLDDSVCVYVRLGDLRAL